jgi:hypothetical protein
MGDTLQQFQNRRDEQSARELLEEEYLHLDEEAMHWILNHIDCFVSLSRGNKVVKFVYFQLHSLKSLDDEVWDKVGQAIGNLQALESLQISNHKFHDDDEVVPIPDWDRLACILSHIRQKVELNLCNDEDDDDEDDDDDELWAVGEVHGLARAIRGHPTITSFDCHETFPYESMDSLYLALATLPALGSIRLTAPLEDEIPLAIHVSLAVLLRSPSLRSVSFSDFFFTSALCQAIANVLVESTAITNLEFWDCSFPAGGECLAMMANGLARNTSLISTTVGSPGALFYALAAALPLNTTLQELLCWVDPDAYHATHADWSPMFLALGRNHGLKTLTSFGPRMNESLCTAMQNGLGTNTTLEKLVLQVVPLRDDTVDLWCRTLSSLRTNKVLKTLVVRVSHKVTESCFSAFRINIMSMLQDNASLETLSIQNHLVLVETEVYIELVTMLQHNATLKRLELHSVEIRKLTDDEDQRMAKSLQKNYALESLPNVSSLGDVSAILRLNAAGRRYLIEDGSSVSKGVEVLIRVNNDINCVFLHLLENPTLCDRSAVQIKCTGESNRNPTVSSDGEKRE